MIALGIALLIFVAFMIAERALRTDASSASFATTEDDKGTTRLIGGAYGLDLLLLVLSLPANRYRIGTIEPRSVFNAVGIVLMLAGLIVRIAAARTLGRFYSRTLKVREGHRVVSEGIYGLVRHPGYLGVITLFFGAGISVSNYIVLILIVATIVPAYLVRIGAEEAMLRRTLGSDYVEYCRKTRRLIPFIY